MTKILGLDLGTNSIGWAVVDKTENKIEDAGVRIFPEGVEPTTIGKGDKEQSKNATRRENRQARKQFYRKRLRKIKLLEVLIEQEMCPLSIPDLKKWKSWDRELKTLGKQFPNTPEFIEWIQLNPYQLRAEALTRQLTFHELGRVFYHLIQRRGFLSSRKGKEDTTIFTKGKPEENILSINETKEAIGESTLGNYLSSISYKEKVPYATVSDISGRELRVRGRYTLRSMYIEEFEKIWQVQAALSRLDEIELNVKRTREIKGKTTSKRNQNKIEHLRGKFGAENVKIEGKKVLTNSHMTLKEFLGGNIWEDEGEIKHKSNESTLFWQRPLKSQKGLLSNCSFENEMPVIRANGELLTKDGKVQKRSKKPCPLSHPEFELFRACQFINNIKYGKNHSLTDQQREVLLDLINSKDSNFDFANVPKKLKLTYEKFNFDNELKVPGNPTIKKLKPLFTDQTWEEHFEEIWHSFYFFEDNDKLFEKLKNDFEFKGDIDSIKGIRLKEGYSNVSLKAIRNILPFLKKGYQYDRAVILGGVRNAFGKSWDYFKNYHEEIENGIIKILKQDNKEGEAIQKIKEFLISPGSMFGFVKEDKRLMHLYHHSQPLEHKEELEKKLSEVENLRNPIVQQGLNEMKRLVNTLLDKYRTIYGNDFHFDLIKVEMGRDLRNSKKQRQEMGFRIAENEEKNNEARNRLAEYGLKPSRDNIQKYLMFQEIEKRAGKAECPYTGKTIAVSDVLGKDNTMQIEHIIPYSISLDDSFGNKTLCEANFNRNKGEKTPYQYYQENPDPILWGVATWEDVEQRAYRLLPYVKAKRFTSKKEFESKSFIERQLNDSRYIARKSVELLSAVCKDVRVMPGQLTAELRHLWGLNNILMPVQHIDLQNFDVDGNESIPYYLIVSENGEVVSLQRKQNPKPLTSDRETLVPGKVKNGVFSPDTIKWMKTGFATLKIDAPEMEDGKYWAKINVGENIKLQPIYADKPVVNEDMIVFRGRIEKGLFRNDTLASSIKTYNEDGPYWAKFRVIGKVLEEPKKDNQFKPKRNQVMLFGHVRDSLFKCYIYQCQTNLPDGKYWILLDLDFDNIEFIRSVLPPPDISQDELMITATVNDDKHMVSDMDPMFRKPTVLESGKYYAIMEVRNDAPILYKVENELPKLEKGQKLIEGNVWVDKYTGEVKFDPKKNRDDQRHHAIDAIVIALTEQGYLQRLSTYNAQRKEKERGKQSSTEKYPEPWDGFANDVKTVTDNILISYKKSNKTLTRNKKGFSVRGQLHKENVFGKRHAPGQDEGFHRRTKITDLKNNKHIGKVVDKAIWNLILEHLQNHCGVDISKKEFDVPKDAFFKNGKPLLFLPNKKGDPVPIKKVRIKEVLGNAEQLKSDINQYVNPRNNHHVLIYEDANGALKEDVVSFWTVVERKLQGGETYQIPQDGNKIVATLEINDMFVLGLSDEDFSAHENDQAFLSKYLYRVQKLSLSYYTFRFHLASTITNKNEERYIQSFGAWTAANPIKVKIDELGEIKKFV